MGDPDQRSTCPVPFCRDGCPVLPDETEVVRASGSVKCPVCGVEYRDHPKWAYPMGGKHVVWSCDGEFLHL